MRVRVVLCGGLVSRKYDILIYLKFHKGKGQQERPFYFLYNKQSKTMCGYTSVCIRLNKSKTYKRFKLTG